MCELNKNDLDSVPQDKVLVLKSLVCNSTLAGKGKTDQISLRVNGKTVEISPFPMWAGQVHLFSPNFENPFHQTINVELFALLAEEKSLGSKLIMDESGTWQTSFDKVHPADYALTYEIRKIWITAETLLSCSDNS